MHEDLAPLRLAWVACFVLKMSVPTYLYSCCGHRTEYFVDEYSNIIHQEILLGARQECRTVVKFN